MLPSRAEPDKNIPKTVIMLQAKEDFRRKPDFFVIYHHNDGLLLRIDAKGVLDEGLNASAIRFVTMLDLFNFW